MALYLNNETIRLRSYDKLNWVIEELTHNNPDHHFSKTKELIDKWVVVGYYGKHHGIESVLKAILSKNLIDSSEEISKIEDLIKDIEKIYKELTDKLKEINKEGN